MKDTKAKIDVRKCARCGGDHDAVTFRRLTTPPPDHQYWAMCPTLYEPILIRLAVCPTTGAVLTQAGTR